MPIKFSPPSGYLYLETWVMANVIYLGTESFCKRFLNNDNDPKGRLYDQMVMAARSAPANIAEGASRHTTSTETEMKLTDVARATLAELANDYLNWIIRHDELCWSKEDPRYQALRSLRLEPPSYSDDLMHDVSQHLINQHHRFVPWTENTEHITAANALLILCSRLISMLTHQMQSQLSSFRQHGGFAENLTIERKEAVQEQAQQEGAPTCPICGKPMRLRRQTKGTYVGRDFWGCTDYPNCRGTRNIT